MYQLDYASKRAATILTRRDLRCNSNGLLAASRRHRMVRRVVQATHHAVEREADYPQGDLTLLWTSAVALPTRKEKGGAQRQRLRQFTHY